MSPDIRAALRRQLKRDEGTGPTKDGLMLPYRCSAGALTIGYGHNLDASGIKPRFAEYLLDDDIDEVIKALVIALPWIEALDPVRQAALVNMAFNLGVPRLLKFELMLAALRVKDYELASVQALESTWAEQVKGRALRLADQLLRGEFTW
jgi:lysozyme